MIGPSVELMEENVVGWVEAKPVLVATDVMKGCVLEGVTLVLEEPVGEVCCVVLVWGCWKCVINLWRQ